MASLCRFVEGGTNKLGESIGMINIVRRCWKFRRVEGDLLYPDNDGPSLRLDLTFRLRWRNSWESRIRSGVLRQPTRSKISGTSWTWGRGCEPSHRMFAARDLRIVIRDDVPDYNYLSGGLRSRGTRLCRMQAWFGRHPLAFAR